MTLQPLQYALGSGSGALVGLTLGLVGGGGSILAVPLMVYLVGVDNPHVAIGTEGYVTQRFRTTARSLHHAYPPPTGVIVVGHLSASQ